MKFFFIAFCFLITVNKLQSQSCPIDNLGQNPSSTFPVCGLDVFSQSTVPFCGGKKIPGPCDKDDVTDINPFWYNFTCYSDGKLAFTITPNDLRDDYDWQLFDVTNRKPTDVYIDKSLFVACNWSGIEGITGASTTGTSLTNCGGFDYPPFSVRPTLIKGHKYILLVSHFSQTQSGYKLSFGDGNNGNDVADITDPSVPSLSSSKAPCDAIEVGIKLSKKMKCKSLAADGSDFTISPATATIVGATAAACKTGFDMDSVVLTLSKPLPPNSYTIAIKTGTDGNTLLDNCNKNIAVGNNTVLTVLPIQPTPIDKLAELKCAPGELQLIFKKNIRCNSIAANGSDFVIAGPLPYTVISATGNCINGTTDKIILKLNKPMADGGTYQIQLQTGSDGNAIIDECGQETPPGSSLPFTIKDTVSADFNYNITFGCKEDVVDFIHNGNHQVNEWLWRFDVDGISVQQSPQFIFKRFGDKKITLTVSNGFCSATATKTISLNNELKARFETTNTLCPEDAATFKQNSIGNNIISYDWDFGDGTKSTIPQPLPIYYPKLGGEKIYTVSLTITNVANCVDVATQQIKVVKTCYITVPNAFTPNGDGLNDYLYPLNAYKAGNLRFNVYNRLGQLIFHTTDWTKKWDGTINKNPQTTGLYAWTLQYVNMDTNKKVFLKGTSLLIR